MPSLIDLSNALESATDEYATAIDDTAVKQNAYLRAYHTAMATAGTEGVPATVRSKVAEGKAIEELTAWNTAAATEKRCRAKVSELADRLSAHQSYARIVERQT